MSLISPISYLQQFCAEQLTLYSYQNYLEVFVLSFVIYKALRWLQYDYTKPMVLYVYGYCAALICSNIIHAQILFWTLLICAPILAILCIIAHQTNIQKYFAQKATATFEAQALPDAQWIDILIRSVLFAAHHKKNIFCIIMRQNNVQHFLQVPYHLNTPIQPEVLDLILSSSMIENPSIMLVDHFGNLKYINATWSDRMHEQMIMLAQHSSLQHCQYAASIVSNKTDAMIWYIDPISHHATAWHDGTIFQNISIDQLLTICKKMLPTQNVSMNYEIKGNNHAQKHTGHHTTPPQY